MARSVVHPVARVRWLIVALLVAVAAPLLPGPVAAQDEGSPLMQSTEYREYELSMEKVRRWARAAVALERFAQEDASFDEAVESEELDGDLDAMLAVFERYPAAVGVLEREGISARDYALISFAIAQAMGAVILRDAGMDPSRSVPEAHVRFLEANQTELRQLLAPLTESG